MYTTDAELVFPPRIIPELCGARSRVWQELVESSSRAGDGSIEQAAFGLMMARLNNCVSCNADSFRAIQGCSACSKQTLKRFHGSDDELQTLFLTAKTEIQQFEQRN
jgi:hypothetical protein